MLCGLFWCVVSINEFHESHQTFSAMIIDQYRYLYCCIDFATLQLPLWKTLVEYIPKIGKRKSQDCVYMKFLNILIIGILFPYLTEHLFLVSNRRQSITWTDDDLVHGCMYVSPGLDVLKIWFKSPQQISMLHSYFNYFVMFTPVLHFPYLKVYGM